MHSSLMLREGARPEVVRDNMGHANIDVTQNVYGKSWREERVDAVTRAVDALSAASRNKKNDQPEQGAQTLAPVSNEDWVPLWVPIDKSEGLVKDKLSLAMRKHRDVGPTKCADEDTGKHP